MSKHTPGPWIYEGGNNACCEVQAGETTIDIVRWERNTGEYVIEREEMEANAKLIAAAPELLEALKIMTSLCRTKYGNLDKDVYAEILKAEEAINKATT